MTHRIDCDMDEDCDCEEGFNMNDPGDVAEAYAQLEDERLQTREPMSGIEDGYDMNDPADAADAWRQLDDGSVDVVFGLILPDPPEDTEPVGWCQRHFAGIRDGGSWAIPRSGLIFRKEADPPAFRLVAAMPWMPEMEGTVTREQLAEQQRSEFELNREHFERAGIAIVGEEVLANGSE